MYTYFDSTPELGAFDLHFASAGFQLQLHVVSAAGRIKNTWYNWANLPVVRAHGLELLIEGIIQRTDTVSKLLPTLGVLPASLQVSRTSFAEHL
jgi:hypothetical protein